MVIEVGDHSLELDDKLSILYDKKEYKRLIYYLCSRTSKGDDIIEIGPTRGLLGAELSMKQHFGHVAYLGEDSIVLDAFNVAQYQLDKDSKLARNQKNRTVVHYLVDNEELPFVENIKEACDVIFLTYLVPEHFHNNWMEHNILFLKEHNFNLNLRMCEFTTQMFVKSKH